MCPRTGWGGAERPAAHVCAMACVGHAGRWRAAEHVLSECVEPEGQDSQAPREGTEGPPEQQAGWVACSPHPTGQGELQETLLLLPTNACGRWSQRWKPWNPPQGLGNLNPGPEAVPVPHRVLLLHPEGSWRGWGVPGPWAQAMREPRSPLGLGRGREVGGVETSAWAKPFKVPALFRSPFPGLIW